MLGGHLPYFVTTVTFQEIVILNVEVQHNGNELNRAISSEKANSFVKIPTTNERKHYSTIYTRFKSTEEWLYSVRVFLLFVTY